MEPASGPLESPGGPGGSFSNLLVTHPPRGGVPSGAAALITMDAVRKLFQHHI